METKKDAADFVGLLLVFAGFAILASEPAADISRANIMATNITAGLLSLMGIITLLLAHIDYGRQKHH